MRANIERLVGGATEETIVARVGEGIVSAIGSAASHEAVLENPDSISNCKISRPTPGCKRGWLRVRSDPQRAPERFRSQEGRRSQPQMGFTRYRA